MVSLKELIEIFKECPEGVVFKRGFEDAHSYRGYYDQLAVEPTEGTKIEDMIETLENAVGESFTGYKGGSFLMYGSEKVYLSFYGRCSGDIITGWAIGVNGYYITVEEDTAW